MKKYLKPTLAVLLVIFALVFAFIYGGNTPEQRKKAEESVTTLQQEDKATPQYPQISDGVAFDKSTDALPDVAEGQTNPVEEKQEQKTKSETDEIPFEKPTSSVESEQEKEDENPTAVLPDVTNEKSASEPQIQSLKNPSEVVGEENKKTALPTQIEKPNTQNPTCTLTVTCGTLLSNLDSLDKSQRELVPSDGVIFPQTTVSFATGESVFDVLCREMRNSKIHLEFSTTPALKSAYIEGINNIYEFDCGELSGWMYSVNGKFPSFGCSDYELKDGDSVVFAYTTNLGKDIGANIPKNENE